MYFLHIVDVCQALQLKIFKLAQYLTSHEALLCAITYTLVIMYCRNKVVVVTLILLSA